jgi:hypothetical protein
MDMCDRARLPEETVIVATSELDSDVWAVRPGTCERIGTDHLSSFQILGFYGRSSTVEHDLAAKSCETTQHVETIVWPIYLA